MEFRTDRRAIILIVTFCGHSQIYDKDTVRKRQTNEIHELLRTGHRKFYLGGYGDFDNLAAAVLDEIKETYPNKEVSESNWMQKDISMISW